MLQDGGWSFGWGDDAEISVKAERTIEDKVEHAIDRSFDKMEVIGSDGQEIEVPAETKRAMADAVGRWSRRRRTSRWPASAMAATKK